MQPAPRISSMTRTAWGFLGLTDELVERRVGASWQGTMVAASIGLSVVLLATALSLWPSVEGAIVGLLLGVLMLCGILDFVSFRIPNALTYSGTTLLLGVAALSGVAVLLDAVLGVLIGGGFLAAISVLSRGKVGLGDAKLSGLGGGLVGGHYVLHALFFGTLAAAVLCFALVITGRLGLRQAIPYGPFLSFGFIVVTLAAGASIT